MPDCITIRKLFHVTPKDFDFPQVGPLPNPLHYPAVRRMARRQNFIE
jgi:hypothetical protein